jgi:hypothetical protein
VRPLADTSPDDLAREIAGWTDQPEMTLTVVDPREMRDQFKDRGTSARSVSELRVLLRKGVVLDPILIAGTAFLDGGHRVQAHVDEGRTKIQAVDISSLVFADWSAWDEPKTEGWRRPSSAGWIDPKGGYHGLEDEVDTSQSDDERTPTHADWMEQNADLINSFGSHIVSDMDLDMARGFREKPTVDFGAEYLFDTLGSKMIKAGWIRTGGDDSYELLRTRLPFLMKFVSTVYPEVAELSLDLHGPGGFEKSERVPVRG